MKRRDMGEREVFYLPDRTPKYRGNTVFIIVGNQINEYSLTAIDGERVSFSTDGSNGKGSRDLDEVSFSKAEADKKLKNRLAQ